MAKYNLKGSGKVYTLTDNADTVKLKGKYNTVLARKGNDVITVSAGTRHIIYGEAGNDTIVVKKGAGTGNKIYGNAGNDTIKALESTKKITIYGGDGTDIIYGGSGSDILYGQAGKDKLYGGAGADYLYGGSGNDKLYGGAGKDTFVYSDGKDTIYDYETGKDTIKLVDKRLKDCVVRGKDVQLTLKEGGLITVKNAAGKQIKLIDESGQNHYLTPVSQQSVIEQVMKSLDNATTTAAAVAVNTAVNKASGGAFGTYFALIMHFIYDVKNYGGTEKSEYGEGWDWKLDESSNKYKQIPMPGTDKFLKDFCGIDLTNDDTGSMSGYDVGGTKVKTAESIMPGKELLADAEYPTSGTTTINGLTIHWPDKNSLSSSQQLVVAGLYSYLAKAALDLVKESYEISYADSDVPSDLSHMKLSFFYNSAGPVATAGATQLNINMYYFNDLDDNNWNWNNLGRSLAHEFTHGVMNANLDPWLWYNLGTDNRFAWLVEGLAELTQGLDDIRLKDICELSQVSNASELERVLGNYSSDVNNYHYAAGYMLLRYLAKQVADNSWHSKLPQGITGDTYLTNVTISSEAKGTFDVLYYGNRIKIINFDKDTHNVKVWANELQNIIYVDGTENTVNGDDGDDVIIIEGGNKHTVSGGQGIDHITVGEDTGKDIKAYGDAGDDVIRAWNRKGVIINGGSGNDTLYGGSGKDEIYGDAGDDTLYGNAGSDTMYGSEGNDYLSGGAGNDRLYGDEGDDIMEGGSGKNTFLGGAGKDCFRFFSTTGKSSDTVLDYKAGLDIIEFGDNNLSIASSEVKEGNVTLHMNGGGTINILNAAGQEITFYSKEQSTFTRIFS